MFIVKVFAGVLAAELLAALCPRALEDLEVPVRGSRRARILVPVAPLAPRPLEDLEVPLQGSF